MATPPITNEIRLDNEHSLVWRTTPWDAAVFEYPTGEILSVRYKTVSGLRQLLERFAEERNRTGLRLCVSRVDANERPLRQALVDAGFTQVETSLRMHLSRLESPNHHFVFPESLTIEAANPEDRGALKTIAFEAFHYTRFHEDPFVDPSLAHKRCERWIDDLLARDVPIRVHRGENGVDAFVAFSRQNTDVDLVLMGSAADRGFLTPPFCASFLQGFRREGVHRVNTMVSAANVAIVNIYARLGFSVEQTLFGYHWHKARQ